MKVPLSKNAKAFRRRSTDAERRLWSVLRNRRFEGLKFRRQHPIGK
jgi:very-short-patch-repair endonuclease